MRIHGDVSLHAAPVSLRVGPAKKVLYYRLYAITMVPTEASNHNSVVSVSNFTALTLRTVHNFLVLASSCRHCARR